MFEKIVIHALMSPDQLRILKHFWVTQKAAIKTRTLLLVLIGLFLGLQYIGMYHSSDMSGSNDQTGTIAGGFSSNEELLFEYDRPGSMLAGAATALHLSRGDLSSLAPIDTIKIANSQPFVEWSTIPTLGISQNTFRQPAGPRFMIFNEKDPTQLYYGYPVESESFLTPEQLQNILVGNSQHNGRFFIRKNSGNIVTNWEHAKAVDECYSQPSNTISYLNCPDNKQIKTQVIVDNLSYKTDASFIKNRSGDVLHYRLKIDNKSPQPIELVPGMYVGDLLEYTEIVNLHGAQLDNDGVNIIWRKDSIPAQASTTYSFSLKIHSPIPITAQGDINKNSHNCKLDTYTGRSHQVALLCPTPKIIERLLHTNGSWVLLALSWVAFVINLSLLIRAVVLERESRLLLQTIKREQRHAAQALSRDI